MAQICYRTVMSGAMTVHGGKPLFFLVFNNLVGPILGPGTQITAGPYVCMSDDLGKTWRMISRFGARFRDGTPYDDAHSLTMSSASFFEPNPVLMIGLPSGRLWANSMDWYCARISDTQGRTWRDAATINNATDGVARVDPTYGNIYYLKVTMLPPGSGYGADGSGPYWVSQGGSPAGLGASGRTGGPWYLRSWLDLGAGLFQSNYSYDGGDTWTVEHQGNIFHGSAGVPLLLTSGNSLSYLRGMAWQSHLNNASSDGFETSYVDPTSAETSASDVDKIPVISADMDNGHRVQINQPPLPDGTLSWQWCNTAVPGIMQSSVAPIPADVTYPFGLTTSKTIQISATKDGANLQTPFIQNASSPGPVCFAAKGRLVMVCCYSYNHADLLRPPTQPPLQRISVLVSDTAGDWWYETTYTDDGGRTWMEA